MASTVKDLQFSGPLMEMFFGRQTETIRIDTNTDTNTMDKPRALAWKAIKGIVQLTVVLGALVFLPAWSFNYWQGWVYLSVLTTGVALILTYLVSKDPALFERRLKAGPGAETEKSQKIIQVFVNLVFAALAIFPGIDHRFGWSHAPLYLVLAGDTLVALGLFTIFLVFKENSYAANTITVEKEQRVVSTGPYALVRHPMYTGGTLLFLGIPLALGSLWGLLIFIPGMAVVVWRIVDEEKYLIKNLPGYVDYCSRVRRRLIPGIY